MHRPLRPFRVLVGLAVPLFCLSTAGCASDEAMEKRVNALQEELDRVQSRADRLAERLTALEVGRQKRTVRLDQAGAPDTVDRPELEVVKVAPKQEEAQAKSHAVAVEDARDDGPRPVIRAVGSSEGRIENLESSPSSPPRQQRREMPDSDSEGGR